MRTLLAVTLTALLAGCVTTPSQKAQFNAEYPHRQDIRQQSVYHFMTKPVSASGKKYWGSDNVAELFYVSDNAASMLQLRFNYPGRSVEVSSLDTHQKTLRKRTFALLDESAAKPSNADADYLVLTKGGQLMKKTRNCTPDMSVGCRWWNHTIFITRHADMAVHYEEGGAGLIFLIFPFYDSSEYLRIFQKVTPAPGLTS
ncbi:hypothetical protein WH279_14770 [Erwinia sp. MYb375]|uniref:hypothetical protein n=1 Tax=Erwinia sp. MYb375 TaxID=2745272 RepID=UPI0030B5CA70